MYFDFFVEEKTEEIRTTAGINNNNNIKTQGRCVKIKVLLISKNIN